MSVTAENVAVAVATPVVDPKVDTPKDIRTIEHAGVLDELTEAPAYLRSPDGRDAGADGRSVSCSFCGVGDGGTLAREGAGSEVLPSPGAGTFTMLQGGRERTFDAELFADGAVRVQTTTALTYPAGVVLGRLHVGNKTVSYSGRLVSSERADNGTLRAQRLERHTSAVKVTRLRIKEPEPTSGCVKLRLSQMGQRAAYPIHVAPSVLDPETGERRTITYAEAIERLADLLLEHRQPKHRTLLYASGQIDYFSIFGIQEVFRLLGVRNLTGNAEHCLNAGAVHNEVLTGQEGPFLTIEQSLKGPNRVYLMNGWNGLITHPPVYRGLMSRDTPDGFLVDVMVTETAKGVAKKMGVDRVLMVRPRSDPQLALAVAHEILTKHESAIDRRFIERFADRESLERYMAFASTEEFAPERVAARIAPEPQYEERILKAIRLLAAKLAEPTSVPIVIPSVGLSQSSGIVAHCLWGNVLGMLGKYGLRERGEPAGGVLRVPGQINAESEVQGLSRKYFVGRIPMADAADAAQRMGLPEDAYQRAVEDTPRPALNYADTTDERELFVCMGTQFEANMPNRRRWLEKLTAGTNKLVVIDPIPDPWSLEHAELVIPSPPHPATTKLYQNGEWKLTLSQPQRKAAPETRSDATIVYDVMAAIVRRLEANPALAAANADLTPHLASGYLRERFVELPRQDGEVNRAVLWERLQDYLHGGRGPLYCSFDHADGRRIEWRELLERGSIVYGGVGEHRFLLDYDDPDAAPFRNIYREPGAFRFFLPEREDLELPEGIVFNSGRSSLTDDRARIHFATSTFNSGKATPVVKMPEEHPLYVSPSLATRKGLETGDRAKVTGKSGYSIELPVVVTNRVKGDSVYVSFHRSNAQHTRGLYINDVTDDQRRCRYSAQVELKTPAVTLEAVRPAKKKSNTNTKRDVTTLDTEKKIPVWTGKDTPLFITDIIRETSDVYTFRLQGDPICRFVYKPGQFCSVALNIDGKEVIRSYSISSTPTRPYTLELTVKRVPGGLVSNWMPDNLKVGDQLRLRGPSGKFCLTPGNIPPKLLLVGAGSGVTPLMSMARWLCDLSADVDIRFYYCVRSSADIIFSKELEMMTRRYRMFAPCVISTTRDRSGLHDGLVGRINRQMLELIAPDLRDRHIYMCGPEGFMSAVKDILSEVEFDLAQLHTESFTGIRTPSVTPAANGEETAVAFAKSGKVVKARAGATLLEVAEENGVDIDYGCRSGSCGDCKVRVIDGDVAQDVDDGLTNEELNKRYVLSCVARAKGKCVIDA